MMAQGYDYRGWWISPFHGSLWRAWKGGTVFVQPLAAELERLIDRVEGGVESEAGR